MNPFDFYIEYEFVFAAVQLSLAMLGMGATLTLGDFGEVARDPKGFSVGIVMQIVLVPLAAFFFLAGLELATGIAIGLALCAAIPGGTVSNIFTYIARGHVALSIALTAIATIICLGSVPVVLDLLVADHLPGEAALPAGDIAIEIALYLLLPLALGMLVLDRLPTIAPAFSKWCIRLSLFTIVLIVIGAMGAGRLDFAAFGWQNAVLVWGFITVICVMTIVVARLARLDWADTATINIEVVVRNTNLGILIKASVFPAVVGVADPVGDMVLFTLLFYGGVQIGFAAFLIPFYRRLIAPALPALSKS
ncbi:MAG: bile acid:sodium symporter family protein [Alphaproteobacteria bacterium]